MNNFDVFFQRVRLSKTFIVWICKKFLCLDEMFWCDFSIYDHVHNFCHTICKTILLLLHVHFWCVFSDYGIVCNFVTHKLFMIVCITFVTQFTRQFFLLLHVHFWCVFSDYGIVWHEKYFTSSWTLSLVIIVFNLTNFSFLK